MVFIAVKMEFMQGLFGEVRRGGLGSKGAACGLRWRSGFFNCRSGSTGSPRTENKLTTNGLSAALWIRRAHHERLRVGARRIMNEI